MEPKRPKLMTFFKSLSTAYYSTKFREVKPKHMTFNFLEYISHKQIQCTLHKHTNGINRYHEVKVKKACHPLRYVFDISRPFPAKF